MISSDFLSRELILNWLARVFFFVSLSALLPTFPNHLDEMGSSKSQIGVVMSAFAIGMLVFRPIVGKQIDQVGRKVVLVFGAVIFSIAPIFYMFVDSIPMLIMVRAFHGLGLAAFGTASITLITDCTPIKIRGEVYRNGQYYCLCGRPDIGQLHRRTLGI